MSEQNNQVSDQGDISGGAADSKEQFVHKKAFEDVTKDMHKYKSALKDKQAYIAELEAKQAAIEESALAEKQQYKTLFEKRDAEFQRLQNEVEERDRKYLEAVKKNALKAELGNRIKDEYLVHADISSIQFSEGSTIDRDSLIAVANQFRQNHPELVPTMQQVQHTGMAPISNSTVGSNLKPLSQMNETEKRTLLKNPALMEEYRKKGLL